MNKGTILTIIAILLMGLIVGKSIATSPQMPLILTVAIAVGLLTLVKTDAALIILIFAMLFSPELKAGGVAGTDRGIVIRVDDILLIVIFFTWLAKTAVNKQLGLLRHTPLNRPIVCYILVCILATVMSAVRGRPILRPLKSTFFILKYIQYFMLYFMVTNNIRSKKQIKVFIIALLITCALVCIYASVHIPIHARVSAPFEPTGEPNTLGGYLILLFAISAGLFLYSRHHLWRLCTGALACFIILPLLFSLSRGSYLGFIAMYLALIILTRRMKTFLIILLLLAIPLFPIILPARVINRVTETFVPGKIYEPLGERIALDESSAARIETWKGVMGHWKNRPLLGYGVAAAGFVDSQPARVIGETGAIGAWIFVWLMLSIFRIGIQTLNTVKDNWDQGLVLGFLAGFIGLLIHSFSASTFIIVRIMEPFWFLTAIVVMLPEVSASPQEETQLKQS